MGNPFTMGGEARLSRRDEACNAHDELLQHLDAADGGAGGVKPGIAVDMAWKEAEQASAGQKLKLGKSIDGAYGQGEGDILRYYALIMLAEEVMSGRPVRLACHCAPEAD